MKRILIAVVAITALMAGFASPALAQDQSISADPATVDAPGEHTVVVTGSGYSEPGFLLPCPGAGGDPAAIAEDSCNLEQLTPVAPDDDGNFSSPEVTFDIPAEGLVIVVGNAAQTEVAATVITVGGDDAAAAEEEPAEEEEEAPAADTTSLPATGVESYYFAIFGVTVLAAGALVVRSGRQIAEL